MAGLTKDDVAADEVALQLQTVQLGSDANWIPDELANGSDDLSFIQSATIAKKLSRQLAVKPDMTLPPYGSSWALDPFWLIHNALRRELLDLYSIVMSLERRSTFNPAEEIMELIIWWKTFSTLVSGIFGLENRIIFPWAFRNQKVQEDFFDVKEKITARQQAIVTKFTRIEPLLNRFQSKPTSTRYDMMIMQIDVFIKLLLEHFEDIEKSLEPMVLKHFGSQAMKSIEARLVTAVLDLPDKGDMFVCLVKPMSSSQRSKFISKYLNSLHYTEYKNLWRPAFDEGHAAIPCRFRERYENY